MQLYNNNFGTSANNQNVSPFACRSSIILRQRQRFLNVHKGRNRTKQIFWSSRDCGMQLSCGKQLSTYKTFVTNPCFRIYFKVVLIMLTKTGDNLKPAVDKIDLIANSEIQVAEYYKNKSIF